MLVLLYIADRTLLGVYYFSISLLIIYLFNLVKPSWLNFGRAYVSRYLFISSRFSSLLEYKI
jgi:hypothetical protein